MIIAPNGRVEDYLIAKEKRITEQIQAILDEEKCAIVSLVNIQVTSLGNMGVIGSGWGVSDNSRMQKPKG